MTHPSSEQDWWAVLVYAYEQWHTVMDLDLGLDRESIYDNLSTARDRLDKWSTKWPHSKYELVHFRGPAR